VLLNITPDHLDRYDNFEAYAASKKRLFQMQSQEHHAFVGESTSVAGDLTDDLVQPVHGVFGEAYVDSQGNTPMGLRGAHNGENVGMAVMVCEELGLNTETIFQAGKSFAGLPHRTEQIRDLNGVLFVNDSKATNPTATAPALAAFEHIRWILGGQAKTDNLEECAPNFGHVVSAYTIGEAAELFERLLSPHIPVKNCGKLDVAVREAAADAEAGDTVLLSPACASFDQFRDFEDRGDQFRALVGEL
jgi:UDP-N-acetylmuramoylalanine--D-glutamate ligase